MKYKKEIVSRIVETLESGDGRVAACKNGGISYETFMVWLREKPEFSELVKKAEETGMDRIMDVQIQKILSNDSWQSAAWWLERNHPERFAKRESHDMTTKGEKIQLPTIIFKRQTKDDE